MSEPAQTGFLAHFSALRDPRQSAKVLYPLPEVLLLLLCATISGADDFVEITLWGEERLDFLRRFQLYAHDIPSHDTLCDVVAAIDPEMFKACFLAWVEGLRADTPDMIAIDGKTSRRSHARSKGRLPLHTVSAWATRQRLVLGQEAVAEKSNEITAIPILLQRLELAGALVTIDAMGTQTEIAQTILDGGGDYVLTLKENWPATCAEVAETFAVSSPAFTIQRSTTVDADHGRSETRRHAICHDIDWMFSDRRYSGELKFPGLAAIGMVKAKPSVAIRSSRKSPTTCVQPSSTSRPSRVSCVGTGGSRTARTGCRMSSSMMIWRACHPAMAPQTWRSSSIPHSISLHRQSLSPA